MILCPKCSAPLYKEWKVCVMCKHKRDDKTLDYTNNMIDINIMEAALEIHTKNVLDAKIKEAVQAINEVECAVNEKQVRVQILKQQVEDALVELNKYTSAKEGFLSHRDIQAFRKEVNFKQIIC